MIARNVHHPFTVLTNCKRSKRHCFWHLKDSLSAFSPQYDRVMMWILGRPGSVAIRRDGHSGGNGVCDQSVTCIYRRSTIEECEGKSRTISTAVKRTSLIGESEDLYRGERSCTHHADIFLLLWYVATRNWRIIPSAPNQTTDSA